MAAGDIYQVILWTQHLNQAGLLIHHMLQVGAPEPPPTGVDIANGMFLHYQGALANLLSIHAHVEGAIVKKVFPLPATASFLSTAPGSLGAVNGDAMSNQTAGLISLQTDVPGRAGRGRKYIPFPSEEDNDIQGVPTAPYLSDLLTLAGLYTGPQIVTIPSTPTVGVQFQPVIFHRSTNTATPITMSRVRTKWATQRRRSNFGATNVSPFE